MNAGCLEGCVKIAQRLDSRFITQLALFAESRKGFLCNFQIPMMYVLASQARGNMAEIGCWYGRATSVILAASCEDLRLFCIDTFKGSEEHQQELNGHYFRGDFERNLDQLPKRYSIIEGMSHEISQTFDDQFFTTIWIDASHDFDNVSRDINNWLPKLKSGGMLVGHDYPEPTDPNGGFEDLSRAVNQEVRDNNRFSNFGWCCGIWAAIKK